MAGDPDARRARPAAARWVGRAAPLAIGLAQTVGVGAFFAAAHTDRSLRLAYILFAIAYALFARFVVYLCNVGRMGFVGALLPALWMWRERGDPWYSRLPHHGNGYVTGVLYNAILALLLILAWLVEKLAV